MRCFVVGPMLACDVGGVFIARNVPKLEDLSGNSLADTMIGQGSPSLVELRMWDGTAGNYRFVASTRAGE